MLQQGFSNYDLEELQTQQLGQGEREGFLKPCK